MVFAGSGPDQSWHQHHIGSVVRSSFVALRHRCSLLHHLRPYWDASVCPVRTAIRALQLPSHPPHVLNRANFLPSPRLGLFPRLQGRLINVVAAQFLSCGCSKLGRIGGWWVSLLHHLHYPLLTHGWLQRRRVNMACTLDSGQIWLWFQKKRGDPPLGRALGDLFCSIGSVSFCG